MKVLIIGGVAGGASAAARLRRLNETAEIIIIERSGFISYANCGLPYYIGGDIKRKEALTLQTPNSFFNRFNIDVRVNQEAYEIDRENKKVYIKNLINNEIYEESYDKLILAPGAKPFIPDIKGIYNDKVFTLRNVEDTFKIKEFIDSNNPKKATVIGGGFIGLEMAENLVKLGVEVTIIEKSNHVLGNIDNDIASVLHNYMRNNNINLLLNRSVLEIEEQEELILKLDNNECIQSNMIILASGVIPESTLAKKAGLELGIKDAIITNAQMQTSDPNIYAVGDAVQVKNFITNQDALISLAGPANKQGRIAADNICGINKQYKGSIGSSILKMFDMTIASTGLSKEMADRCGVESDYVILTSASHATYYPGAQNMYVKVLFEKNSGIIIGGQIIGFNGVDKRIDVLATAIKGKFDAYELSELDLAYAPPYSSAKDPINMAGFAITNILDGLVEQVHWEDVNNVSSDVVIIDARTDVEFQRGHLENVIHIPLDSLRERINEIPKDKTIYVYCHSGLRSYLFCRILKQKGYKCFNVSSGYGFYQNMMLDKEMSKIGTGPCGLNK